MAALRRRVFLCTRLRPENRESCGRRCDTGRIVRHLEERVRAAGAPVEVLPTRCLGHCTQGPTLFVHPDKAWYTYADERDIDEIVAEHLVNGRPVHRLLMEPIPEGA